MSLATERACFEQLEAARDRLKIMQTNYDSALRHIEKLEQQLLDHAEDWALAGIPHGTDLSNKLALHFSQRHRDRADAARWRDHIAKENPPVT